MEFEENIKGIDVVVEEYDVTDCVDVSEVIHIENEKVEADLITNIVNVDTSNVTQCIEMTSYNNVT